MSLTVYAKIGCPFTTRTEELLRQYDSQKKTRMIYLDPRNDAATIARLKKTFDHSTLPIVLLKTAGSRFFIGGYEQLKNQIANIF